MTVPHSLDDYINFIQNHIKYRFFIDHRDKQFSNNAVRIYATMLQKLLKGLTMYVSKCVFNQILVDLYRTHTYRIHINAISTINNV